MRALTKSLVLVLSLVLGAAWAQQARADMALSLVGALGNTSFSVSPQPAANSYGSGTSVGFGVLGSTSVFPLFSLETGALYVPRKFSINDAAGNNLSTDSFKTLQIPLLLRFTGLPIVSIGGGVYYALGLGSITVTPNGGADQSVDFSAANLNKSEFGLEASLAADIPLMPLISVTGDLRYLQGLTNMDATGNTTQHFHDFQLLAGLKLSL